MSTKDVKFSADGRPLEAALAEGLEHPGIVRVIATAVTGHGATDLAGETWLVMELCNGGDLQARPTHLRMLVVSVLQVDVGATVGGLHERKV